MSWITFLLTTLLLASGSALSEDKLHPDPSIPPIPSPIPYAALASGEAYRVLGVSQSASPNEIEQAYSRKKDQEMTNQDRARLEVSHAILATPDLKKQYDAGKGGETELDVPVQYRAELGELLKQTNPKAASRLARTGHVTVDTLGNMTTFYLTMGTIQAAKCLYSGDPTYCRHYIEDLKKPSGHIAFGLFIGSSKLASMGVIRAAGDTASSRAAAGFIGLAAGSMVNDVFLEFVNLPATKEYLDAMSIPDAKESQAKKDKAWEKIRTETFGNKDWYIEKVPNLINLLGASYASDKTWHFALQGGAKALQAHSAKVAAGGSSTKATRCFFAFLQTYVLAADKLTGTRKFAQARAMEGAGLLVFQAWSSILNYPVKKVWDYARIDQELAQTRRGTNASLQTYLSHPDETNQESFKAGLESNAKLWDAYRRKQTRDAEQIMSLHHEEMDQFQKAIDEPDLFYGWFVDGLQGDAPQWDQLKERYFDAKAKPTDPAVKKEIQKHLQGFFCGPLPADAFHDSRDWRGLPVPGHMDVTAEPYRVAAPDSPAVCKGDPEALSAQLKKRDYRDELRKASIEFKMTARKARLAKLEFYEKQIRTLLIEALQGNPKKTSLGLTEGVLPSFELELADLKALQDKVQGTPYAVRVIAQIESVIKKRESANDLLKYMQEEDFNKRKPPDLDLAQLLGEEDPTKDTDWSKVIKYYHGFILQ